MHDDDNVDFLIYSRVVYGQNARSRSLRYIVDASRRTTLTRVSNVGPPTAEIFSTSTMASTGLSSLTMNEHLYHCSVATEEDNIIQLLSAGVSLVHIPYSFK